MAPVGGCGYVLEENEVAGDTYCTSSVGSEGLIVNGVATVKRSGFTLPANTNPTFLLSGAVN